MAASTGPSPAPVTYPHLGTLLVAGGIGLSTFSAAADGSLPASVKGILVGVGAAASAVGLFLLGRSSV